MQPQWFSEDQETLLDTPVFGELISVAEPSLSCFLRLQKSEILEPTPAKLGRLFGGRRSLTFWSSLASTLIVISVAFKAIFTK